MNHPYNPNIYHHRFIRLHKITVGVGAENIPPVQEAENNLPVQVAKNITPIQEAENNSSAQNIRFPSLDNIVCHEITYHSESCTI